MNLAMRAPKPLSPFICGSTLSIADFSLACFYHTVKTHEAYKEIEPLIGSYHMLKPYWQLLETTFELDLTQRKDVSEEKSNISKHEKS